jgi:hypothetical protein
LKEPIEVALNLEVLVVLTLEWDSKILVGNKSTVDLAQELTHGGNERQTCKVRKHMVWVLKEQGFGVIPLVPLFTVSF